MSNNIKRALEQHQSEMAAQQVKTFLKWTITFIIP
jgi:hypothetical protein